MSYSPERRSISSSMGRTVSSMAPLSPSTARMEPRRIPDAGELIAFWRGGAVLRRTRILPTGFMFEISVSREAFGSACFCNGGNLSDSSSLDGRGAAWAFGGSVGTRDAVMGM